MMDRNLYLAVKSKTKVFLSSLSTSKSLLKQEHPSAYPFLSGDFFRSLSDLVVESKSDIQSLKRLIIERPKCFIPNITIFASASWLESNQSKEDFVRLLKSDSLLFSDSSLLIHNGDKIPEVNYIQRLAQCVKTLYCVNLIEEKPNMHALPIGIENLSYLQAGLSHQYRNIGRRMLLNARPAKKTLVFGSFSIATNLTLRSRTATQMDNSRFRFNRRRLTQSEYMHNLATSCFSISPPGNGPDCHRTWESIYLGSVPVVLKSSLAPSLVNALPILSVDSYESFLHMSDCAIRNLYDEVISRPADRAYAQYWVRRIKGMI